MSSTNKTSNYQLSQFVGSDIPSILNDYNGDMRKIDTAIHDASVAGGDNATAIAELQSTTGRLSTEMGGINSTVNSLSGRVVNIEDKIPASASSSNKLLTAEDIPDIPSIESLEQEVDNIKAVVPATASVSNKLATMADISSSEPANYDDAVLAIRTTQWFRFKTIYSKNEESTLVEAFNNLFNSFKEQFQTLSSATFALNVLNLIIKIGTIPYHPTDIPDVGTTIAFYGIEETGGGLNFHDLRINFDTNNVDSRVVTSVTHFTTEINSQGITRTNTTQSIENSAIHGIIRPASYLPWHANKPWN